ncbi:hypothetical protein GCM10019059_29940 [Camelimonas fluminis]|uniref:Zinc ribbon domain-containing protein n=1 Tax=Camelimonas fluminis TaxID=1576911 RepID=A0ABV7UI38_9HYPH|nr:zinc ribbon domain-containing protein [Camelimonas fluminis]GHE68087.1 hypothetical protein GCM10019059_29940 [Camelimonas fluminis]
MSLISCPECGRQISDRAPACPGCGYPVADDSAARPDRVVGVAGVAGNVAGAWITARMLVGVIVGAIMMICFAAIMITLILGTR